MMEAVPALSNNDSHGSFEMEDYDKYMKVSKLEKMNLDRLASLEKVEWFKETRILKSGEGFGGFADYDPKI